MYILITILVAINKYSGTLPEDHPVVMTTLLLWPSRYYNHLVITLLWPPRYYGHLVITTTLLLWPPCYYDHLVI